MTEQSLIPSAPQSLISAMAARYGIEPDKFLATVKATIMPKGATNEQIAAFLMVANEYKLSPFTREIFAFPSNGGIVPVVSVDGWIKLINEKDDFDGFEFEEFHDADGKLVSITCSIFRRGRSRPTSVNEKLAECVRNTAPWKQHETRMLRHKSIIQCGRVAYGFAGIYDPDEAERFNDLGSDAPISTIVARTQERQTALREKLETKALAAAPIDVAVPSDIDPLPMGDDADTAEPEPPANAEGFDEAELTQAKRAEVHKMLNSMAAKDRKEYFASHDMTGASDVDHWSLDMCENALDA